MRRGWCPTVFAPMRSGDGLLVRVKPPGSRLSPTQASALAEAAARDGNGAIDLTARANLQVRGLTERTAPRFARAMVDAGLACADPAAERRRNVVTGFGCALDLDSAVAADASLAALPDKFGFAADVPGVAADVRIARVDDEWLVWPDGAARATVSAQPVVDALRLARAFLAVAPDARRMRDADAAAVFAAAGLHPSVPVPRQTVPQAVGEVPGGFGVGLPFGATDADTLAVLADAGPLHLTPWRTIVVAPSWPGLSRPSTPDVRRCVIGVDGRDKPGHDNGAPASGLILDPADPRRAVSACPGRPACASAQADTRADAARLAALFPGLSLHVSGCAKGCAHPAPAAVTLVAQADGYALVRDGTAADPPRAAGLTLAAAAAIIAG